MPEPHLRASDADRAAVAQLLGDAMSTGRLTVAEYDERLTAAYAARTHGELAALTTDLPAAPPRSADAAPTVASRQAPHADEAVCVPGWGHGAGHAWGSWLSTAVIVLGIWALTSLAAQEWIYPWPVWVIGPWGVVLLAQALTGRHRPDGPGGRGRDRQRERSRKLG